MYVLLPRIASFFRPLQILASSRSLLVECKKKHAAGGSSQRAAQVEEALDHGPAKEERWPSCRGRAALAHAHPPLRS